MVFGAYKRAYRRKALESKPYQPKMVKYARRAGNKAEFTSAQLEAERSFGEQRLPK
ncbi:MULTISPECIES: hypothetical protein [unclassified Helicobacter]|uniref:hypothetical protein n=1 Tax=unclassified Helicobacter TaxID=2593540 RepID=UPI0015F17109|nr:MULTISPECIES: hypothetical protein [unclassified Helicobacter]